MNLVKHLGQPWIVAVLGGVGLVLIVLPAKAYSEPTQQAAEPFSVYVAPNCAECYEDALMGPVQLTVNEEFGLPETLGGERTAVIEVRAFASVSRDAFEKSDDGSLDWIIYATPDITEVEVDGRSCPRPDSCSPGEQTEDGYRVAIDAPASFVTLGFSHIVELAGQKEPPDSERVLIALQARLYVEHPYTHRSNTLWLENWQLTWSPRDVPTKFHSADVDVYESLDWMHLTDTEVESYEMEYMDVDMYVCPSCAPVAGYHDVDDLSLSTLRDRTTAELTDPFDWSTSWNPWSWFMPSYIGFLISTVLGFFLSLVVTLTKFRRSRAESAALALEVARSMEARDVRTARKRARRASKSR